MDEIKPSCGTMANKSANKHWLPVDHAYHFPYGKPKLLQDVLLCSINETLGAPLHQFLSAS